MKERKLKALVIIEQCNPELASVPLVGYNLYNEISNIVDTTLITHERNRDPLERARQGRRIEYIKESKLIKKYYRLVKKMMSVSRGMNWPLKHTLTYPVYGCFNNRVYRQYKERVLWGEYDIVHSMTPMIPRYPVKIIEACNNTPFILGPVNGGIPFPSSFQDVAKKEYSYFNFLRLFSRFIPGYMTTYQNADRILSGSTYTLNMMKDLLYPSGINIDLFFENGIYKEFINEPKYIHKETVNILFVGRLVPYKGLDMVIDAIGRIDNGNGNRFHLNVVGDGPERHNLERQSENLGLGNKISFTGWVGQRETLHHYKNSDIFCFPSIREFGGAVVLEAMACGLPCIIADQGGIGEYVTNEAGFKIKPISRDYLVAQLTDKINVLVKNEALRFEMGRKAFKRAKEFEWSRKARSIVEIYRDVIEAKSRKNASLDK